MVDKSAFYEAFDADWNNHVHIYRELAIVDSEELLHLLYKHRLLHLAFVLIDSRLDINSSKQLSTILRTVSTGARSAGYARVTFISSSSVVAFEECVNHINQHFHDLLIERRVYCSVVKPMGDDASSLFRAIGAAQPVFPESDSTWRLLSTP